jgi:hypothetical protein
MKKETIKATETAFRIARAFVDNEYSKNHLHACIDRKFGKSNFDHQTDLIELADELERGEREFKDYVYDNNNKG